MSIAIRFEVDVRTLDVAIDIDIGKKQIHNYNDAGLDSTFAPTIYLPLGPVLTLSRVKL